MATNDDASEPNYFDIISFKDRIKDHRTLLNRTKNFSFKIFFTIIFYYFTSKASGYLIFLNPADIGTPIPNFQFLTGFLILAILSQIWGWVIGGIGGLLGDIIYQFVSNDIILWEYTIAAVIIGIVSGLFRYQKEKFQDKRTLIKVFYSLVLGIILSMFIQYFAISMLYPAMDWSALVGQIALRNLLQFIVSEIISVLFLMPLITLLIDLLLKRSTNQFGCIYRIIFTHHTEFESDHAIPLNIGGYNVFFCTRCSGMFAGIIIGLFIESILILAFDITIDPNIALFSMVLLPIPGFIDWGTQKLGYRKSSDVSRVITGVLLGITLHMATLTEKGDFRPFLIILAYFLVFGLLIYFGNKKTSTQKDNLN